MQLVIGGMMMKKTKITFQAAESKIRLLLRPWMYRKFQFKKRVGILEVRIDHFTKLPPTPEIQERIARLEEEAKQLYVEYLTENQALSYLVKELSSVIRNTEKTMIPRIKLLSRAFLLEYRRSINEIRGWCDDDWMADGELEDLVNLAVFTYLELWLDKDRDSYLTIEQFANHGYRGEDSVRGDRIDYVDWKAKIYRAYTDYGRMYQELKTLKKEMSEITHPVPYKQGNERKLSLLDLAWGEAWAQGGIDIQRKLFFQKTLKNRKSEHDTRQNEGLKQALNAYAHFVENVNNSYPTNEKETEQYKAYVARCILIQRLERAYQFSLAGQMAEYAQEHGCSPDAYNQMLLSAYTGVYQNEEWMLFGSNQLLDKDGLRKNKQTFHPYRTLGFEDVVEQIFEMEDPVQIEKMFYKELFQRMAADNLINILVTALPLERRPWKDDDFRAAAEFLKKDYLFLDRLVTTELPVLTGSKSNWTEDKKKIEKRTQKFLDYYCAYYLRLYQDERTQIKRIVQKLKESKEKGKKTSKQKNMEC